VANNIQTATTGQLEDAQNIILEKVRYTAEHNAPCWNTVEQMVLAQGAKSITVPKVGTMTISNLQDGVDIVDNQDIGMTTTSLTTSEVGAKVILTDKLLRQESESPMAMVGNQLGDAMARKRDEDIIALFSGFSNTLGADNKSLWLSNAASCVAYAKAEKFPNPIVFVHHPYALAHLAKNAAGVGTAYYAGVMQGLPESLLRNFWKMIIDNVNFISAGNIAKISGYDSAYGAIYAKSALCAVSSKAPYTATQRDESLRATELVIVADYGVFELDDAYGAKAQYEIGTLSTSATE